jgi:hypothetical protein
MAALAQARDAVTVEVRLERQVRRIARLFAGIGCALIAVAAAALWLGGEIDAPALLCAGVAWIGYLLCMDQARRLRDNEAIADTENQPEGARTPSALRDLNLP